MENEVKVKPIGRPMVTYKRRPKELRLQREVSPATPPSQVVLPFHAQTDFDVSGDGKPDGVPMGRKRLQRPEELEIRQQNKTEELKNAQISVLARNELQDLDERAISLQNIGQENGIVQIYGGSNHGLGIPCLKDVPRRKRSRLKAALKEISHLPEKQKVEPNRLIQKESKEKQRKKRKPSRSAVKKETSGEGRDGVQPCPLPVRDRRKRKNKKTSDASDSEVTCPRPFRQFRRDRNRTLNRQTTKLDSNTFELCLENLWMHLSEEQKDSFMYIDSLWFSLYANKSLRSKVLDWIKEKGIFSKKYVFVPIVQWSHWCLLIFCHLGESLNSKTRSPCMLLLDSLQMADPKRREPDIRRFVFDIYRTQERLENLELIQKIPLLVPKVPQQRNGEECGNFVLYYIKLFLQNAPQSFSISEGYPYFMTEEWFTREGMEKFCEELYSMSIDPMISDLDASKCCGSYVHGTVSSVVDVDTE